MFLKSMEIRGFKSFADKTDLIFKKGVTAVVGPNGSGKSNISDAVRWVLGEQSVKSLRGGKMEDVIFAGTQFRKPLGLAQVSLTLDNSDLELPLEYSDVTVSRRLYRSGESEYYINNTHCRLKDIQELFMDTGIGKEGYSIIGQGKIDAILSGKPEERRGLLEEAAGIVKFKNRKEEAEKKLENTDQNLLRINDILGTYEERLEPLRIENEKAKKFLELSDELKDKEINLIIHSIDKVQNKINLMKDELEKIQDDINNSSNNRLELKSNAESLEADLEKHELETQNQKQYYYENKTKHQDILAQTNLLNERLNNLLSFIEKTNSQIEDINKKLNEVQQTKNSEESNLSNVQNQQMVLNEDINKDEKVLIEYNNSITKEDDLIKNLKDDSIEYLSKISELKNNILIISNEKDNISKKISQLKSSCENYINSLKINSNTKTMMENEIIKIHEKVSASEEKIRSNKNEIVKLNHALSKDEKQLKDLNAAHNKLEANHQMLNNLEKQYEGYNRSVKTLMQHISNGKIKNAINNCFVLGDVISVKKDLETAIEIALGGAISDIITSDEAIAKDLIKYLKENNIGRATFLPLTIIRGKKITDIGHYKNINGFIGIASELIGFDNKFSNAIEFILGRTIISRDMDSALNIARKSSYSFKIVTLSGEVVNPGGSLTGGSIFNKSSNIIGRKREIEELRLKIDDTSMEIDNISTRINQSKANIKALDDTVLNLKDQIYHDNIELTKINEKISSINNENEKLTENINISTAEINTLLENIKLNDKDIDKKNSQIMELNSKEQETSQKISELESGLKERMVKISELREKLTAQKIKKAQIDEIVGNRIKELERLSREFDALNRQKLSLEDELVESKKNKDTCIATIESNKLKVNDILEHLERLEESFKEKEVERLKIKENIKIISGQLEQISLELNRKEDEKHRQEINYARLDTEKGTLYSKLNEEMELTYAEALKYKSEIENMDRYKKDIETIKGKITSLGVVNVGAIEEYKDIKEKYTFMNIQKEDLIKAKEELIAVINDMTSKMKEVFNENFAKLREYFNDTFRELFKGGRADLILADGDELTANIDINVEPPGKKLQNINLMSGGEKVLSAIALLFAILKMKPTPFCILDEIEAALDDANVFRYAEFLQKFSSNIQFIVITHRKGTMEASDVLYGVTMEEKGVSKIVSVDLKSAETAS